MKRITFFINSLSSGGAEHQLVTLANFLSERNYDITITTISDTQDHYVLNKQIKRVSISKSSNKIVKLLSIWRYFISINTDCVIIFCQRNSYFALPALWVRSRKKIKVICGERNLTVGAQDKIEKLLFNHLYKRADYIVPNSYSQGRYISEKAPWLENKLIPITNYTSLDLFCYHEQPQNKKIKIGVFCRYEKQKNCLGFINAIRKLKEQNIWNFQIFWFGSKHFGNSDLQDYYDQIENKIQEYKLEGTIFLNDAVKNVSAIMATCDVICLPSFFEGFSNTISEAICCGRPVLCSDVSDNSLMVQNKKNGFLFNPYNIDSIVDAFKSFFQLSQSERKAMGKNSRVIAEKMFNKEHFVNSYIKLIEEK